MQQLPHLYRLEASAKTSSTITVNATNLPSLEVAPPIGFGGPGNIWSPEDMFVSTVATCTILSFRAIARASKFDWIAIHCDAQGTLDRIDRKTRFTKIVTQVKLTVPSGTSKEKAIKLLNKAEETCLISNSLTAETTIECEIVFQ